MRILFIAPLPPPITGLSLASKILLNELEKYFDVDLINYSKNSFKQGIYSIFRFGEVLKILLLIYKNSKNADGIYLTISQSITGNIKDILTYLLLMHKLSRVVIHLHGGGIKKIIFDKHRFLYKINIIFLKRIGGAIVLGESLTNIFSGIIPNEKIHIVKNFAEDNLFIDKINLEKKFFTIDKIKILFLSNLIPGKGYIELIDAFFALDPEIQSQFEIHFAGGFENDDKKENFLKIVDAHTNLFYHGVVQGEKKQNLFFNAHIFCLPTYYYYEGQPISILEAYASGCVVLTTEHGGIIDIFKNRENGFFVEKKSYQSIKNTLEILINFKALLIHIALNNRYVAEKEYRKDRFCKDVINVLTKVINK